MIKIVYVKDQPESKVKKKIGRKVKLRHCDTLIVSNLMEEFIKQSVYTQRFWIVTYIL